MDEERTSSMKLSPFARNKYQQARL